MRPSSTARPPTSEDERGANDRQGRGHDREHAALLRDADPRVRVVTGEVGKSRLLVLLAGVTLDQANRGDRVEEPRAEARVRRSRVVGARRHPAGEVVQPQVHRWNDRQ